MLNATAIPRKKERKKQLQEQRGHKSSNQEKKQLK